MISLRYFIASFLLGILGIVSANAGTPDAAGNYGGVLEPQSGDPLSNSGLIQLQLSKAGVMSGVMIWQGVRYPFKGVIRDGEPFSKAFNKKLSSLPTELRVFLSLSTFSRFIDGTLAETASGSQVAAVNISLSGAPADPTLIDKLQPGLRISFIDPPNPSNEGEEVSPALNSITPLGAPVGEIPGDGFVHVRISKSKKRATRMVGRLPDARGVFTAGSPLRGANYAIFSSLYKKKRLQGGQLFGNAGVSEAGQSVDLTSTFRWGKDVEVDSTFYPGAFDLSFQLNAVSYPKLKHGALVPLLPQSSLLLAAAQPFGIAAEPTRAINARMIFRRGNLSVLDEFAVPQPFFKQDIKITPFQTRMVGDNPHQVRLHVDAFSGRFRGSFMHPNLGVRTRFRGAFQAAVLFTPGQGRGHFRQPSGPGIIPLLPQESGAVRINPN